MRLRVWGSELSRDAGARVQPKRAGVHRPSGVATCIGGSAAFRAGRVGPSGGEDRGRTLATMVSELVLRLAAQTRLELASADRRALTRLAPRSALARETSCARCLQRRL
mmetsp:Transcript_91635/g.264259  ORF Transcript_91635/g.264259 Transcript_91635/m.264259 type:complete len:109 (-) Transcript_91635:41-367(-)